VDLTGIVHRGELRGGKRNEENWSEKTFFASVLGRGKSPCLDFFIDRGPGVAGQLTGTNLATASSTATQSASVGNGGLTGTLASSARFFSDAASA
jgi:hypothetical protein